MSPASRMSSAISFGVFWRLAPSTSAIIRSRKLSPAFAVTRTTISSESTRVPPVTAERSPPDSRITGADSPVIADSSTLAIPSIDVAVGRDDLARRDDDLVADLELRARHLLDRSVRRAAAARVVSARVLRSVAAWALPRPSAMASAKLAKSTVNQSQAAIEPAKMFALVLTSPKSLKKRNVASAAPSSVTNMTGLRAIRRGIELAEAVERGGGGDPRVEDGRGLRAHSVRCSSTGPSETTGK